MPLSSRASILAFVVVVILSTPPAASPQAPSLYDPLRLTNSGAVRAHDLVVHDGKRKRDIPIRVFLPTGNTPAPVILNSHGLGGSREGSAYLGQHWAARGYVTVNLQHPGSDESVWKDEPVTRRMAAMRRAANARNFLLRAEDVPAVLDELTRWNAQSGHVLAGRLNLASVGMAGHSFGAVTTQAVSGQNFPLIKQRYTDSRIKAAVAFSPSSPARREPAEAFSSVRIPWMLMTGTLDVAAIGDTDLASRLAVFPALPPGSKYEVVLFEAEHSAFTDRALPFDRANRSPNHHRVILALSTAFWDAYLMTDAAARAWLDGTGPRSVMEPADAWRTR